MVDFKTYTAIVRPVSVRPLAGGVLSNPGSSVLPVSVQVYFERANPGEVYQMTGVMYKDPAWIQCEVADAVNFVPDAEVEVAGRLYVVRGQPEIHDLGDEADHADVLLELKTYAIPQVS